METREAFGWTWEILAGYTVPRFQGVQDKYERARVEVYKGTGRDNGVLLEVNSTSAMV